MHQRIIVIYIYIKFYEILFCSYLFMAPDGHMDQTDRQRNMDKTLSLRLRPGDNNRIIWIILIKCLNTLSNYGIH